VLTDYHLHLRPDDTGEAGDYFSDQNVDRYLAAAEEHGIDELGVSEHVYRFTQALEIWNHPYWERQALDDLDDYVEFVRGTPLRLGIECDFVPGSEDRIANLLERDFDYVIGSVHFLGPRGAVDDRRYDVWEEIGDPDEVWSTYFRWQAELARSGLFDIVSHPDLVKIWGADRPQPQRDPRFHYEPLVEAISESGIGPGSASRWRRSTRRARSPRCASRQGPTSRSPPTPTRRTRWASVTTGRSSCSPHWVLRGSACSRAVSGASSRSAPPATVRVR
jgi:histidinol-phosphatase (PHP family)